MGVFLGFSMMLYSLGGVLKMISPSSAIPHILHSNLISLVLAYVIVAQIFTSLPTQGIFTTLFMIALYLPHLFDASVSAAFVALYVYHRVRKMNSSDISNQWEEVSTKAQSNWDEFVTQADAYVDTKFMKVLC
jgi:hypothetical protein